jgi:DNA-binding IclR family transcriptional regulator
MIQSINKALAILSLFSYSKPSYGLMEIASILGLPKGTAHNIIRTLEENKFLQQDKETRKYSLGAKILTLGTVMTGTIEINRQGAGPTRILANKTGLLGRIAIWDQDAALITYEILPRTAESISRRIGPRVAAYCSAIAATN